MTDTIPVSTTDKLRRLKVGKIITFGFIEGISARAIAARLAREEGLEFSSKREGDKIRMWRKC